MCFNFLFVKILELSFEILSLQQSLLLDSYFFLSELLTYFSHLFSLKWFHLACGLERIHAKVKLRKPLYLHLQVQKSRLKLFIYVCISKGI